MGHFGFVILHYMAYDVSCRCLDSLLKVSEGRNVSIVVVDNCSPDDSGTKLEAAYGGRVTVLRNSSNEGFARGNNLGCEHLRAHCDCDFIVVMNNDVIIEDSSFFDKVEAVYARSSFAVLGPDIVTPSGEHQNPRYRRQPGLLRGYEASQLPALRERYLERSRHFYLKRLTGKIKSLLRTRRERSPQAIIPPQMEGVVLHGACLIFSRDFIQAREHFFNPGTFLYMEEDILHCECMRSSLRMLYDGSLQVLHLEDASTSAAYRRPARAEYMKLQEHLRSLEVLSEVMNS